MLFSWSAWFCWSTAADKRKGLLRN